MASDSGRRWYQPGEIAPTTGIYSVRHHGHRNPHQATVEQDETFPACRQCGNRVRFRLMGKEEAPSGKPVIE